MQNFRLDEVIRAAGGLAVLARRIGISQLSLSNWPRVPAEQVLSVEAASGIDRAVLRPDLYGKSAPPGAEVDELDAARAEEYSLLAVLLARAPDADLLGRLAMLRGDPSPLGIAHAALAEAAGRTTVQRVESEYFDLFIGLGRGELLPYGSYYLTGFLHEGPLARLRRDLGRVGIERAPGQAEPEDHAAILCAIMAGVVGGRLAAPPGADRELFQAHLAPWMGKFFVDLECADAAGFYCGVAALGRTFIEIEVESFALPS